MYLKLALRNVRRSVRDYSVYFATLAFAGCLLYAFTASGDYLLSMDLTEKQRSIWESSSGVMEAFSVFSVVVFAFLIGYANRFILRRRSREFGLYGLMGMDPRRISRILAYEGCMVGAVALATGIIVGAALSPLFGAVASFVFQIPWSCVFVFSPDAARWTAICFAIIMTLATAAGMRDVRKRTLGQLMSADRSPDAPRRTGFFAPRLQLTLGLLLCGLVWAVCIFQPVQFIVWILPLGVIAVLGTAMVFRWRALTWPNRARKHPDSYWRGLRFFAIRQVESRVSSSANAMACTCVLLACGVCMMVAGLAFSVGMRTADFLDSYEAFATIGYVGIFYGMTFLVAAAAVLALQQLSDAADSLRRFDTLKQLGCSTEMMRSAVRRQTGTYFAMPLVFSLVHDVFGLALVGFVAFMLGSAHYFVIVATVLGITLALVFAYYLITVHQCAKMLLAGPSRLGQAAV